MKENNLDFNTQIGSIGKINEFDKGETYEVWLALSFWLHFPFRSHLSELRGERVREKVEKGSK